MKLITGCHFSSFESFSCRTRCQKVS